MECMCAQTRPRFIFSSEIVFGGNGVRTHASSKGKIPSAGKMLHRVGSDPQNCIKQDSEPNTLPSYSSPIHVFELLFFCGVCIDLCNSCDKQISFDKTLQNYTFQCH